MNTKKALCIGIDNYLSAPPLNGCVNDALLWKETLKNDFGFDVEPPLLNEKATTKCIKKRMTSFLGTLKAGDLGVIFYAAHGDRNYRKGFCYETIYTYNTEIEGAHHLRQWIDDHKLEKAKLIFIADTCHSGTLTELGRHMNLAYAVYGSYKHFLEKGRIDSPIDFNAPKIRQEIDSMLKNKDFKIEFQVSKMPLETYLKDTSQEHINMLDEDISNLNNHPNTWLNIATACTQINDHAVRSPQRSSENSCNPYNVNNKPILDTKDDYEILLAACDSAQKAHEYSFKGKWHGLFSYSAIEVLKDNQNISYNDFEEKLKNKMAKNNDKNHNQSPVFQGSKQKKEHLIFT